MGQIEDNRLILERASQLLSRLRKRFSSIPQDVSLVDELIAERRKEAQQETEA